MRKKVLYSLAIISICLNILFIAPYIGLIKNKIVKDEYFDDNTEDSIVIKSIVDCSMSIKEVHMSQQEFYGLPVDFINMFRPKRHSEIINNFYTAYNLVGLSQYGIKFNNKIVMDYIQNEADRWMSTDFSLNYELQRVDQTPIGIVYLNLYRYTNNINYLKTAEYIFNFLKNKREKGNVIPYINNINNYTDAVGMYVPFLMEYYELTKDTLAKQIAIDNIMEYKNMGCDTETHIPFHGYNIETGIKLGSCNWGRGIGWFLLAVAYCQETNDSILYNNIERLSYTQFPLSSYVFDSSTALMFEIYKQSTDKNRVLNIDFIKPYIKTKGIVSGCSGDTYSFNRYSNTFGDSELCNGFFLMLYSKFSND